jgi:hypothetical protein
MQKQRYLKITNIKVLQEINLSQDFIVLYAKRCVNFHLVQVVPKSGIGF